MKKAVINCVLFLFISVLCGCQTLHKAERTEVAEHEVSLLKKRLAKLEKEKNEEIERLKAEMKEKLRSVTEEKKTEVSALEKARQELEQSLRKEIGEYKARLEMTERGLVITFLDEIFFDSGKDLIRIEGEEVLGKVAEVLKEEVIDSSVAVEGHTDNVPIKYSGWKSNWELSAARALAVVHYLTETGGLSAERFSAVAYGEFQPVADNEKEEGRQQNRRVEIIILPAALAKE